MTHQYASMPGYTPTGRNAFYGWDFRVAYALDQGVKEIRAMYPAVTCVGTNGDYRHFTEGGSSMHNPIVYCPHDKTHLVLAVDLVGPQANLNAIRDHIEARYNAQDPRQYPFGFTNMNGYGTVWDANPGTTLHETDGDFGHLHWNINSVTYPVTSGDYRDWMDSTASWGFRGGTPTQGDLDMTPQELDQHLERQRRMIAADTRKIVDERLVSRLGGTAVRIKDQIVPGLAALSQRIDGLAKLVKR